MVVVSGDQDDGNLAPLEIEQSVVDDRLGVGRGREMVEDVSRDSDDVNALGARELGDLGKHLPCLVDPRSARKRFTHVPVAGVEQSHWSKRSNGSPTLVRSIASLTRVAQAGKGK